jgi:amino acid transporter
LAAYLIAGASGANAPLVVALVLAGSLALGWTVSLYGRRIAGAGAVYEYLSVHARRAGVLGAGLYFLPAIVTNAIPLATSLLFQAFAVEHLGFDPGWWAGGVFSTVIVFVLAYLGVRLSVRMALGMTAVSAAPMIVLAVVVIAKGGAAGNTASVFDPSVRGGGHIFTGVLFAVLLFAGFEGAACVGEEARLPHREIPRAILLSVALAGVFFLLTVYAATIGFGPRSTASQWGGNPVAFAALGDRYVGHPSSTLISLGILLDSLAVQLTGMNVLGRGYYALARDGLLPRALTRTSPRDTPVAGLAIVAVSGLAVLAAATIYSNHFDMFSLDAVAAALLLSTVYIALALGAARFVMTGRVRVVGLACVLAGTAVPVLGIYGTLHPFPSGPKRVGVLLAAAASGGVLAWFGYLHRRRHRELDLAASRALRPVESPDRSRA